MYVAEAALERIAGKDGRGTRGMVTGVGDIARLMDGARCRETDRHAVIDCELVRPLHRFPHLHQRAQQIMAGPAHPRLPPPPLPLHAPPFPPRLPPAPPRPVLRPGHERLRQPPRPPPAEARTAPPHP